MATPSDFGFDHDVKFTLDGMIAHMQELGLNIAKPWTKSKLLPPIERYHAQQRELHGTNDKEYLAVGFDPNQRKCTKAKLRQILSQYDICYPSGQNGDKPALVTIFQENLNRLRQLNARSVTPPRSTSSSSPGSARQLGRSYRTPPSNAPSSRRTTSNSARQSPLATSSQTSSSQADAASSRTADALSPEQLASHLENLCVKAVRAVQSGNYWRSVQIFKRGLKKCTDTAEAEDERARHEEYDSSSDYEDSDAEDARTSVDLLAGAFNGLRN